MNKPANYPNKPSHVWNRFFEITQTPRPSKKEGKFREYLIKVAKENSLKYSVDNVGNVVIYVEGGKGRENSAPVILQNHMDMVTDATPDRKINFETDPISIYVDDGHIKADRTTLGADNGIGCATALALIDDKTISHPPLELLFTVDEETGLNGAKNLDVSLLKGKKLINLDTEDWGAVFVGCAGGIDYEFTGKFETKSPSTDKIAYKITVGNLRGGHSGCDIHLQLGNALKILSELMYELNDCELEIASVSGGKAHNIIPRDADAVVMISKRSEQKLLLKVSEYKSTISKYLSEMDRELTIDVRPYSEKIEKVLSTKSTQQFLQMAMLFPHGPHTFILDLEDMVRLSNNMAIMRLSAGELYIETSVRFTDRNEAIPFENRLNALASTFNMSIKKVSEYPSWNPNFKSSLLNTIKVEYKKAYGEEIEVKVIHAGLECGILLDKIIDAEAISIGPNLRGAHSPSERLEIKTVEKTWDLLSRILSVL